MTDLKARAERLRELHGGEMLVLPNAWDAASAAVVVEAGFPVVATASAAVSAMLGYPDGEGAPWQIYPIGVRHQRDIASLVTELPGPINGNTSEELDLATLRKLGVARVSYGPRFYFAGMADLKTSVQDLLA